MTNDQLDELERLAKAAGDHFEQIRERLTPGGMDTASAYSRAVDGHDVARRIAEGIRALSAEQVGMSDSECTKTPPPNAGEDHPETDGTDAAHPAWWRAHDHTAAVLCQAVNRILDGQDDCWGVAREPWESTRRRLQALRSNSPEAG